MPFALPLIVSVTLAAAAPQQPAPARPADTLAQSVSSLYKSIRRNLLASAEKMPEEGYAFRPTPDVRTFGQLIGHVTNTQYNFCAPVVKAPTPKINHETLTSKAELVKALGDALAYCDKAYEQLSDETLHGATTFGTAPITNGYTLVFNIAHDNEHYGNIVTYLRMKGLVPPSSERAR